MNILTNLQSRLRPDQKKVKCKLTRPVESFTLKVPLKPEQCERVILFTAFEVFNSVLKNVGGKFIESFKHQVFAMIVKFFKTNSGIIRECEEIALHAVKLNVYATL